MRLGWYFFKQALVNVREHRMVHLLGTATVMVSLLIFGAFLLLYVNLELWMEGWGGHRSVAVYLLDEAGEAERERIAAYLGSVEGAKIERFVSKQEALEEFRSALGARQDLLAGLPRNPLPASFEVSLEAGAPTGAEAQRMLSGLKALPGVEEVQYSEDWARRFEGFLDILRILGLVVGGLLGIGILFIVTNTVKLTIYGRRQEIEILKLVGATDWFVRMPFLIEGFLQGLASGLAAVGVLYGGYCLLDLKKMQLFGLTMLDFVFLPHPLSMVLVFLSLILATLGSFLAVAHFTDL